LDPELVNIFGAALASAGLQLAAAMISRTRIINRSLQVKFALLRFTSADLFFSCFDSVAAPRQQPWHHDQVPAKATSSAAGVGLGVSG
jgi:hypothetical protein